MIKRSIIAGLAMASMALTGCVAAVQPERPVAYYAPPPVVVYRAPPPVVVYRAPPPRPYYAPPPRPAYYAPHPVYHRPPPAGVSVTVHVNN